MTYDKITEIISNQQTKKSNIKQTNKQIHKQKQSLSFLAQFTQDAVRLILLSMWID